MHGPDDWSIDWSKDESLNTNCSLKKPFLMNDPEYCVCVKLFCRYTILKREPAHLKLFSQRISRILAVLLYMFSFYNSLMIVYVHFCLDFITLCVIIISCIESIKFPHLQKVIFNTEVIPYHYSIGRVNFERLYIFV